MPGTHTHAADVIFETARSDFGSDNRLGLRVNVVKIFRGGQTNAALERFCHVAIVEWTHVQAFFGHDAPGPTLAGWAVIFKVLEDSFDV